MKVNKTIFTKFIIAFIITCMAVEIRAQNSFVYGNFIKNYRVNYNPKVNNYEVILYFKKTDIVPDSISFMAGARLITGAKPFKYGISSKINLCNSMLKVIYKTDNWSMNPSIVASARNENIKYKGKNVPDSNEFATRLDLNTIYIGGFENNSSYFKDIPLVTIEKGKSNVINLFEKDQSFDSLVFDYEVNNPMFIIPTLDGVKLNKQTGDMYIPNNLDTGFYTLQVRVRDYYVNYEYHQNYPLSYTYFNFTLHVVNEKLPYFIHSANAKIDDNGIYFKYVPKTDNRVNYQADFINPKGLGNYSVNVPSIKPFKKPPTILTTKINDTLLHVDITADLDYNFRPDTNFLGIVKEIPNSFSIIVTTTDSIGNCKQDLTSFYLTNNPTNSINELKEKNKVSVFPNPATNKLNIVFEGNAPQNLVANIYDSKGSLVKSETLLENEINTTNLAQGLYLLTIESEGKRYSSKFIKE